MAVVAFIPVRGGSKSIPGKNIREFCGKPLVYWLAEALSGSDYVDKVVVATDSKEIESVVANLNLSKVEVYQRKPENATDTASTESVMLEYLQAYPLDENDLFVLAQATTPFTQTRHIDDAFRLLNQTGFDSLLTCVRQKRFFWNPDGTPVNYNYKSRPRRQDFDGQLMENGAFYINRAGNILRDKNRLSGRIAIYEMPEYSAIEIDDPDDWQLAENLFRKHVQKKSPEKKLPHIRLFISDVDGVLTDAGMYYSENGDELKKFNTRDGMGFNLLSEQGIKTAIITSENTKLVERRAAKLKIDFLRQGHRHGGKLQAAIEICNELGVSMDETAYIGDDINCFELLSHVGVAACPADATEKIKNIEGIRILTKKGGEGVVREFIELILNRNE
ncbi:acylneuraminate cytidylyltransferase [Alkaliflexus imshenetskii]|uniref:acylneuraminate cytidylyltransferase n=1 Tax=Alkaliflexus imshenetskii TaxID=286730 RepID=UPI00047EEBBE|nr:acylneuraminate cytidylyltransferase [Alkaliflexus imshenetskii]